MQWIQTALGVILGAIITIVASYFFYKKAGDELRLEANRLREETSELNRLTSMLLRSLHNSGIFEVSWKDGKPIGFILKLKTTIAAKSSTSAANLTIE